MKNFQRFSLYCPLTVMHKNVEEIIVDYLLPTKDDCQLSFFWFLAGLNFSRLGFESQSPEKDV